MKTLTIGLPTYNREKQIGNLINFLYSEINALSIEERKEIEIFVSDNCSSDKTENIIKKSLLYQSKIVDIQYSKNKENLGVVENVKKIYTTIQSGYVWLMGDDDKYKTSIVQKVLRECKKNEFSYIFINHSTFKDGHIIDASVIKNLDVSRTDKELLWDLYKKSGSVMMFMSACVHKTQHVKDFIRNNRVNFVTTCSLSFYCASKGKIKVIQETLIVDDYTNISWGKYAFQIFVIEIPQMLLSLPKWGYNRWECYSKIIHIMWSNKRSIIKKLLGLYK